MKKVKRTVCILICTLFTLSCFLPFSAAAAKKSRYVAKISVFAWTKNAADPGHGWVYFENISKKNITVGIYKLKPGKAVSVGVFMNSTRKEGQGVYYNLESYLVNRHSTSGRVSLTEKITADELASASKCINNHNDWSAIKNCAYFAAKVWNSAADKKVHSVSSPAVLKASIKKYKETKNKKLQNVSAKSVYKQKGKKSNPYLKRVGAATLKKSL